MAKKDKRISADEIVKLIKPGSTVMVGGFMATGTPEILMEKLVEYNIGNLTIIADDAGFCPNRMGHSEARGVGKLIAARLVRHIIASHVGLNPDVAKQMNEGFLKCTFIPQGTLAEKMRLSRSGLGGFLTPTGVGTPVESDVDELGRKRKVVEIEGKKYLLELPFKADFALIRASECDTFGNFVCYKMTKNFNYAVAGSAAVTIIASEKVNKIGAVNPEIYDMPGVLVDYVVEGEKKWRV